MQLCALAGVVGTRESVHSSIVLESDDTVGLWSLWAMKLWTSPQALYTCANVQCCSWQPLAVLNRPHIGFPLWGQTLSGVLCISLCLRDAWVIVRWPNGIFGLNPPKFYYVKPCTSDTAASCSCYLQTRLLTVLSCIKRRTRAQTSTESTAPYWPL